MKELVSIIMPCYNAQAYIEDAILSVQAQRYSHWELLIVDDHSVDKSSQIIEKFMQEDSRIQSIKNNTNIGAARSRNLALDKANGAYIAFLDSDDLWLSSKLEKQIIYMQKNNIHLCYTDYDTIDAQGKPLATYNAPKQVNYYDMLKTSSIGTLTMIYNKNVLGKIYFKTVGHEDYILKLDILKKIPYAEGILEPLAKYRRHTQSLSNNKLQTIRWQWKIYRENEKLSLSKSIYYFIHYAYFGFFKY
jgi:glycosyltransferase involved in cell wall biosynthesis